MPEVSAPFHKFVSVQRTAFAQSWFEKIDNKEAKMTRLLWLLSVVGALSLAQDPTQSGSFWDSGCPQCDEAVGFQKVTCLILRPLICPLQ